ncbi:MAG: hypothetical protein CBC01_07710 [Betaproteobacteria bacterium TMED41]|nr:MAG: hypothetical protein CBC01_07710 [Betaproteobacteria bacterium TMED41]
MDIKVIGLDFSSAPKKTKPIIVAVGCLKYLQNHNKKIKTNFVSLNSFIELKSLDDFTSFLALKQNWIGGFDLPFGMPRQLIEGYNWPTDWEKFVQFYCCKDREYLKACFKAWCDSRPAGKKYAWRLTDLAAGSSSAMRWTNPPVAWMMHSGISRMLRAGLIFPAHSDAISVNEVYEEVVKKKSRRKFLKIAFEAYPALLAKVITKDSYKSDDQRKQNTERLNSRKLLLTGLINDEAGLNLKLMISKEMSETVLQDGQGDFLDSVICMVKVSSSILKTNFGLPQNIDPLEGWILCS